jgi:hypothetical protein
MRLPGGAFFLARIHSFLPVEKLLRVSIRRIPGIRVGFPSQLRLDSPTTPIMAALSFDDIAYAMEHTRVLHEPDRLIDTFGTTNFQFHLLTEPMDSVGTVRIREGRMEAERPKILRPEGYRDLLFEGFGEQAEAFAEWFRQHGNFAFFQYGFNFAKRGFTEEVVHLPIEQVRDRILEEIRSNGDPSRALICGVDDSWEVSLLKFTMEMIGRSLSINVFDLKRRGLL